MEHLNVKEILLHGLYNMWKTFSFLYWPSIVNPVCCDAAYDSCGASSCAPHADQHLPGKTASRAQCCLSCRPCYKKGDFLANRTNHSRRISLITYVGSLLLSVLFFQVRHHSPTLESCAELCVDDQTVADWSQFWHKTMSNFILICSLQLILMVVGGRVWQSCGKRW